MSVQRCVFSFLVLGLALLLVCCSSASGAPAAGEQLAKSGEPANEMTLTLAPGVEIVLLRVPASEFLMGSSDEDTDAASSEKPQHKLTLADYYLGKTEVTVAQFRAFVQATKYQTTAEVEGRGLVTQGRVSAAVDGANWQHPQGPSSDVQGKDDYPVVQVSSNDAMAFCCWASEVTKEAVTLPSEAEWEKGARGTDGRLYPWGNDWDGSRCNTGERGPKAVTAVGSYPQGASPYGLLDMTGNVWELTRSLWGASSQKPQFAYPYQADDGREDLQTDSSVMRVARGGSWVEAQTFCRPAYRAPGRPSDHYDCVGFRIVVTRK
jgi:formylglycine-generating enzyme required for sulfatase activity